MWAGIPVSLLFKPHNCIYSYCFNALTALYFMCKSDQSMFSSLSLLYVTCHDVLQVPQGGHRWQYLISYGWHISYMNIYEFLNYSLMPPCCFVFIYFWSFYGMFTIYYCCFRNKHQHNSNFYWLFLIVYFDCFYMNFPQIWRHSVCMYFLIWMVKINWE